MEDSLLMPTTSSSEITLTEASNHSRLCAFCLHTKLNTQRTSSCSEATTSARQSTEFTDSMTSANVDTTSSCGKLSPIALTACLLQLS